MSEINSASFPLYTAHGIRVHFTVPFDGNGAAVSAVIDRLLNDGYMVNAVGLEANEEREVIGWVVRYNQTNQKDGSITPRIFFYPAAEHLVHKEVDRYLNTGEDVAEFERVTGLQVSKLPVWVAGGAPKRTDANASSFVVPVAKPFAVVKRPNPDYKGALDKEHTKYLFVRYEPVVPSTTPPTETRYPAILNRDGKPTGAQPQPSPNPTPPSPSASTAGTATGSAESGNGVKVVEMDGDLDAHLDEVIGKRKETFSPSALWTVSAPYFNARKHFDNWFEKHAAEMKGLSLDDATQFVQDNRWNHIATRVNDLKAMAQRLYGMSGKDVNEALTIANEKTVVKWTDWEAGDWYTAQAALLAWYAGYVANNALDIAHEKPEITRAVLAEAETICESYQKRETA